MTNDELREALEPLDEIRVKLMDLADAEPMTELHQEIATLSTDLYVALHAAKAALRSTDALAVPREHE